MLPSSFLRKIKMLCYKTTNVWPPKPPWGPESNQNQLPEASRGPQNGQNRAPEDPQRRPRGPQGPSKGSPDANLTPPRSPKLLLGPILGPPRTLRNLQNPSVSLRKTMISEFGPGAIRSRPRTRSRTLTPQRDPAGPKLDPWRQGPPSGGKSF